MTIFISHSSKDDVFAEKLRIALRRQGHITWVDHKDTPVGLRWDEGVEQGLTSADIMILVLSSAALNSAAVAAEWHEFLRLKKPIIPVRIEDCLPPLLLRTIHYIDFMDDIIFEDKLKQLLQFLPEPLRHTQDMNPEDSLHVMLKAQAVQLNIHAQKVLEAKHLLLAFPEMQKRLIVNLEQGRQIIGWHDQRTGYRPDVDLRPLDAEKKGVSRQHALFDLTTAGVTITDLSSNNGTRVDGYPIVSEKPTRLANQTVLHLGNLAMLVFLKE